MLYPDQPNYLQPSLSERWMKKLNLTYTTTSIIMFVLLSGSLFVALWSDGLLDGKKAKQTKTSANKKTTIKKPRPAPTPRKKTTKTTHPPKKTKAADAPVKTPQAIAAKTQANKKGKDKQTDHDSDDDDNSDSDSTDTTPAPKPKVAKIQAKKTEYTNKPKPKPKTRIAKKPKKTKKTKAKSEIHITKGITMEGIYVLQMPFMIVFIFFMFSFVRVWLNRVVIYFRELVPHNEEDFLKLMDDAHRRNRRTQLFVTSIYVLLSYMVLGGWQAKYPMSSLYWLVTLGILSVLISQFIASVPVFGKQLINTLLEHASEYNIFDPFPFHMVAYWSMRVTLVMVLAIGFGEVLVPTEELMKPAHLLGNAVFVLIALGLYVYMIYGSHLFLFRRKREELIRVQKQLKLYYELLYKKIEEDRVLTEEFENSINSLIAYEERLLQAPEWPQNSAIITRVSATVLLPMALTWGKKLLDVLNSIK